MAGSVLSSGREGETVDFQAEGRYIAYHLLKIMHNI